MVRRGSSTSSSISLILFLAVTLVASHAEQLPPGQGSLVVLEMSGTDGDEAKLAMTTYDVSLAGFANRTQHWHAFPGHEARIPASTPLRFGNTYDDLIGGLANVPSLPLGRQPSLHAVNVLSNYDGTGDAAATLELKRALATLTVVFCEASRLKQVEETVAKARNGGDDNDARVDVRYLPYIEHWDTISYEILNAQRNGGVWGGPFTDLLRMETGIRSFKEALAVVGLIGNYTFEQVVMAHEVPISDL